MKKVLLLLLFSFLVACKPSRPGGILSEKKMENVLVDYHLAQGIAEAQSGNREVDTYKNVHAVFLKHHITEAEFDSSLVYYSIHAEKLSEIYKHVTARVEARAAMMGVEAQSGPQDIYEHLTSDGDTANIWADQKFCIMQPTKMQNLFRFHIPADSSFHVGDRFLWRFRSNFRLQGNLREVYFVLLVRYDTEPDTVANVAMQLRDSRLQEIRYEPDTHLDTCRIKSVSGYAYWPLPETPQPKVSEILAARPEEIIEIEADRFAQDILLTEAEECELICCGRFNERRCIQHFSGVFHVRPGILVERLQQQGKLNRRTLLNDFKIAV